MSTQVSTYSLYTLFKAYHSIEIPMIQRDYAQGRKDALDIRNGIMHSFYTVYENRRNGDTSATLNLDFVFGDVENNMFTPLDGQQRLTTLFLLHWYAALCENKANMFKQHFTKANNKSKFAYRVRKSSNDFFDELVKAFPDLTIFTNNSSNQNSTKTEQSETLLSSYITDQSWFFLSWSNDPTIQSALNMLDAIHNKFQTPDYLYTYLTDPENPLITFQLLQLEGFGLSEDLYIKMNARGKPLTTFEHTKAKIEQSLSNNKELQSNFTHRIESSWSDLLWKFRDEHTNIFDTQFMNLFRNVMIVTHMPDDKTPISLYNQNIQVLRDYKNDLSFQRYAEMNLINDESLRLLFSTLDHWSSYYPDLGKTTVSDMYFIEQEYIDLMFLKASDSLTLKWPSYEQLVIFYAYTIFVQNSNGDIKTDTFKNWMRIITNLARNTIYNESIELRRSIQFVNHLLKYSHDLTTIFSEMKLESDSSTNWLYNNQIIAGNFYKQQVREEILKAQLIIRSPKWHQLIEQAESHQYFKGQIEFLFDFIGIFNSWKQKMVIHWELGSDEDLEYQRKFKSYFDRINRIFDESGINLSANRNNTNSNRNHNSIWERALLTKGDYLLPSGQNKHLLVNQGRSEDWKRLMRGTVDGTDNRREFVKAVLDDLDLTSPVEKTLNKIINTAKLDESDDKYWRKMLVEEPECIAYCLYRNIRFADNMPIYLLKRSQLNGEHVELYSFYHYHHEVKELVDNRKALPFQYHMYKSVSDTEQKPSIHISDSSNDIILKISSVRKKRDEYECELSCKNSLAVLDSLVKQDWKESTSISNPTRIFTKTITSSKEITKVIKRISKLLEKEHIDQ
jgi:hypothetical protein